MRKIVIALTILFLSTGVYLYSCRNNDLRGWWRNSGDGKTYLVIENPGVGINSEHILDDRPWPYAVGERGEIEPGCHDLNRVGFCVRPGVEYHFDYWGP